MEKLNLQLFAIEDNEDDEFIMESMGGPDEEEQDYTEEPEEEQPEEETEGEEEEYDDEENPSLDKKTKAIIRHKKENQELKRKLQELEDKVQADELETETNKRIAELTRQGKSSTEATNIATDEAEIKKLRLTVAKMELNQLETKYPGISNYAKELSESKAKLPEFTFEQLYLANHYKQNSFDSKTKLEQQIAYKNREAASKSLSGSNTRQQKPTTLSQSDERVYQVLKKDRPGLTRKAFLATLTTGEMDF